MLKTYQFYLKVKTNNIKISQLYNNFIVKNFNSSIITFPNTNVAKITVLKSPHVNKKSRNQYVYSIYTQLYLISCLNTSTFYLLKKLLQQTIPNVQLKITIKKVK